MWIKSMFISTYLTLVSLGLLYASWQLYATPSALEWWAVVVALVPALAFFGWLFVWPVARTAPVVKSPWVLTLLAVSMLMLAPVQSLLAWVLVLGVGGGGWALYQLWYSRFGRTPSKQLVVGQALPRIQLLQTDGTAVWVNDLTGPLLLMFYRGNWCPLCMAQIREVAQQYQALAARGVKTLLISSQPQDHTASLAQRMAVPFHFLVDVDNQVARQLGIEAVGGTPTGLQVLGYDSDTAMPTVVMTDASGTIIFCDQTDNYRVRPEPDVFLQVYDNWVAQRQAKR